MRWGGERLSVCLPACLSVCGRLDRPCSVLTGRHVYRCVYPLVLSSAFRCCPLATCTPDILPFHTTRRCHREPACLPACLVCLSVCLVCAEAFLSVLIGCCRPTLRCLLVPICVVTVRRSRVSCSVVSWFAVCPSVLAYFPVVSGVVVVEGGRITCVDGGGARGGGGNLLIFLFMNVFIF